MNRELKALLFFGGLEIGYNIMGGTNSSPQTTELRTGGEEGGGAAERTLMKWVWLADCKTLLYTGLVSLIAGNPYAFFGGLIATVEMHSNYVYAKACGRRRKDAGAASATVPDPTALRNNGVTYTASPPLLSPPLRERPN
jgi:hypothetical protein